MRDEPHPGITDLPTLALALVEVEIRHHADEARCHMEAGRHLPAMRAVCYHAGRIHGQRLRAWRMVRETMMVAQRIVRAPGACADCGLPRYWSNTDPGEPRTCECPSRGDGARANTPQGDGEPP